ncbi:AraC family transcriptional regulator [Anaerosporobacter sp.]|uniref:AraC family transcriptional regulator n=1 Tax=Anaerosporobacter sp. TaxID=1872529 RepID=UPI00286F286D|nr:AraC family transcriptional regulator [Anaerosporobacter sp.]
MITYMSLFIDLKDDRSEKVHYDYPEYPIYVRRAFLSAYPNYEAPSHWHDDIEFISILSGEMEYNINGEIFSFKSGEGIFVNSRQMHFGYSSQHKECEFICILLHPIMICSSPSIERDFVIPAVQNQSLPYLHLTPSIGWHEQIIEGINLIYTERTTPAAVMKTQSIFSWIWSLLFENMPKQNSIGNAPNNDLSILKDMIGFIQQHFSEKITLPQIANSGSVGQSKCCRLFGTYLNQTPNTYLTIYRLNKSVELLRNSDLSVTEIAFAVGFNGASYYAEAFRKWIGYSPREYRENFR